MGFAETELASFLWREAARRAEDRFAARNFLLDERASSARVASYAADIAPNTASRPGWIAAHQDYLESRVFVQSPETRSPVPLQVADGDPSVAETFQGAPGYLGADLAPNDYLVRVEELGFLQSAFSRSDDERSALESLLSSLGGGDEPASDVRARVDDVLRTWRRDLRPWFATPLADVQLITEDTTSEWANRFRDAAGLYHYDPAAWKMNIRVVMFRYRVSEVPMKSSGGAALLAPCVLDGRISNAFCPSPGTEGATGRAVNLNPPATPIREVVHAPIQLLAAHIHRVGSITSPSPIPLQTCRKDHLEWLRKRPGQSTYGDVTDVDLVTDE